MRLVIALVVSHLVSAAALDGFAELLPEAILGYSGGQAPAFGSVLPQRVLTVTALDGGDITSRDLATSGGQRGPRRSRSLMILRHPLSESVRHQTESAH